MNISFDESAGIKIAGMRKTSYKNNRNTVIKLLNLNKKLGIEEMVLKMGVSSVSVEKTAKRIFEAYKTESFENDLDHPSYVVMSIFQACKLEKVKISKKAFITASNLKPNQWNQMEKTWDKWTVNIGKADKENIKTKEATNEQESAPKAEKRKHTEPEIEAYDIWAKRTLEQAQKDLKTESMKLKVD